MKYQIKQRNTLVAETNSLIEAREMIHDTDLTIHYSKEAIAEYERKQEERK